MTIQNYDDEKVCEVFETFSISILRTKNLPLNVDIYKDANYSEKLTPNDEGVYEDDSFAFEAGEQGECTLYIRIEWDTGNSDYSYSQELEKITLCTNITQVD